MDPYALTCKQDGSNKEDFAQYLSPKPSSDGKNSSNEELD